MVSREEDRYEELRRRIALIEMVGFEILASLPFIGSDEVSGTRARYLSRRYFSDYYRKGTSYEKRSPYPESELKFLLDQISRTRQAERESLERDYERFHIQQSELNKGFGNQIDDVRGKLVEVMSSIETLAQKNADLSAGTHEWLAIQSLGIDSAEVRISRFVPLRVYLSDTPGQAVEEVSDAICKLLEAFSFEISDDFPPIRGSWFKKWFAKSVEVATQPEVIERLAKIERALELKVLVQPQADIDKKQSEAVARLLKAVESIPNAAIQAGSILLVKITTKSGPVIQVRTLTQRELIHLENNQRLLSSPANLLEKLSELCQVSDGLQNLNGIEAPTTKSLPSNKKMQTKRTTTDPSQGL
jgi:hypothetical protein